MIHQVVSMKSGIRMETLFYGAIWVSLVLVEMLGMNSFLMIGIGIVNRVIIQIALQVTGRILTVTVYQSGIHIENEPKQHPNRLICRR